MIERSLKDRPEQCKILEWDSAFFNFPVGQCHSIDRESIQDVLTWCRSKTVRCLFLKISSNDLDQIQLAQYHDFRFVDLRVTLELSPIPVSPSFGNQTELSVRQAREEDIPSFKEIAAGSHEDSRFYMDARFPRDKCSQFYQSWIENSCKGYSDSVLTPIIDHKVAGYVSCHLDPDAIGRIGLFAIHPSYRGKGIGRALLAASSNWFSDHACTTVTVVTQGRNIHAQKLYQRFGFCTKSFELWFHKWFD